MTEVRLADIFSVLINQFHFSHFDIMRLPFQTFLMYMSQVERIRNRQAEAAEVDKWRHDAKSWVKESIGNG